MKIVCILLKKKKIIVYNYSIKFNIILSCKRYGNQGMGCWDFK